MLPTSFISYWLNYSVYIYVCCQNRAKPYRGRPLLPSPISHFLNPFSFLLCFFMSTFRPALRQHDKVNSSLRIFSLCHNLNCCCRLSFWVLFLGLLIRANNSTIFICWLVSENFWVGHWYMWVWHLLFLLPFISLFYSLLVLLANKQIVSSYIEKRQNIMCVTTKGSLIGISGGCISYFGCLLLNRDMDRCSSHIKHGRK